MEWFTNLLRHYPELAIFLTLAFGFWIGKFKIKKFTLGTVTSVLLVGVLIGQLHIDIGGPLKSVFFLMFLFAVGYSVGPQFFRGLKKEGLPQVLFAVVMCLFCLLAPFVPEKQLVCWQVRRRYPPCSEWPKIRLTSWEYRQQIKRT